MTLLNERIERFKKTIAHEKTDRVGLISNFWSAKISDTGYLLSEALIDYAKLKDSMLKFQGKYNFDVHYNTNGRNPIRISNALGSSNYTIDDETNSISYVDACFMNEQDYDALIANPEKFFFETFTPNKFKAITLDKFEAGLAEFADFSQFRGDVTAALKNDYEVPTLFQKSAFAPIEDLGCGMRGLTNISIDIRRRPQKVADAIAALDAYYLPIKSLYSGAEPKTSNESVTDIDSPMIIHTLMNPKAFEKFYWPFLKEIADYAEKYDKYFSLFIEGENSRLYDFFNDLPRHRALLYLEMDDIFAAKKIIGDNVALYGGFPTTLMANGTPEQCVDKVKQMLEVLPQGGGYAFAVDKMISFKRDYNEKNLLAINEAVLNYHL